MRLSAHGLSVSLAQGWEGRIWRRPGGGSMLHAGTFPLLATDGDFGAAATGRMRAGDAFLAVVEYHDPERIKPGVGLFEHIGLPAPPSAGEFISNQLQVTRAGQFGWQRFFTLGGSTFCAYAVLRSARDEDSRLVRQLGEIVRSLTVTPRR